MYFDILNNKNEKVGRLTVKHDQFSVDPKYFNSMLYLHASQISKVKRLKAEKLFCEELEEYFFPKNDSFFEWYN